jgi:hypothetical protein
MRRCAPRRTPECLPTYGTSGGTLNRAGVGALRCPRARCSARVSYNVWNLWRNLESRGCRSLRCPRARCSHAVAPLPIGRPTRRHRPTNTPHPEQTKRADGVGLCACPLAWVCTVARVHVCVGARVRMGGCLAVYVGVGRVAVDALHIIAWVRARACACSSVSVGACWCAFVCAGL